MNPDRRLSQCTCRSCLQGERTVLERQPVFVPAASHGVTRLRILRQGDDAVALWTAHAMGDRGNPTLSFGPHPEGEARSVRAVDNRSGKRARRHGNILATVRASHDAGGHRFRRRVSLPRSNPTTTSSSTMITGTASRPVRAVSSARAPSSSATFFAVNATP